MPTDFSILLLFSAPLIGLALYSASRWHEYERFLKEYPLVRDLYETWRAIPKPPNPRECPEHHIIVFPFQSCPVSGCHFRPPR